MNAYSQMVSRQRRLNCFFDVRVDKDKKAIICRGTPGVTLTITLPNAPIRGYWVVDSTLYVVAGAGLYAVNTSGAVTTISTTVITTTTGVVGMADNGFQLMIVDGMKGYVYTLVTGSYAQSGLNTAGSFAAVTDPNFPNGAQTVQFLNGFMNVEQKPTSRRFYVSAAYDATNWSYNALPIFGTKDDYADSLVAIHALQGTLLPFGGQSIEFWQNAGLTPFPYQRVPGTTLAIGLAAINSVATLNGSLAFLGQSKDGGVQVFKFSGYQALPISSSDVDNIITGFTTWTDGIAFSYLTDGHPMYQLTFPTAGRSFLYDDQTSFWSEVQTGLALKARHLGNLGVSFNTKNYISDATTGNIYQLNDTVYTDNGVAIKRQVTSRHVHLDGNEFAIAEFFADFETGVGVQGNPTAFNVTNILNLPGASGDYVSTPDSNALDITGNIEIICYAAAADWTPAGMMLLVSKWLPTGNQRSYNFFIQPGSTGRLVSQISTDGTAAGAISLTSSVSPTVADGAGLWLRSVRNISNGTGFFYTSTDSPDTPVGTVSWTQLGVTQTGAAGAAFVGTADLEVGAESAGLGNNFIGAIYSAYVYQGIGGGPLKAAMVPNDTVPNAPSWVSKLSGEVWTPNGSAKVTQIADPTGPLTVPATPGVDPQVMLQISRDNGRTFGAEKWTSIGKVGQYGKRAIWRRLGSARDFVFQLTVTDPVKFTIVHASAVKSPRKEAQR